MNTELIDNFNLINAFIDPDGDRVSISTDDELTEALSQFDGTIFRIAMKSKFIAKD